MLRIRRIWLIPSIALTVLLYYVFFHVQPTGPYHIGQPNPNLHLNLKTYERQFPLSSYVSLPTGAARSLPKIQHDFSKTPETEQAKKIRLERRDAVEKSFSHAWKGYKEHAWTKDEVAPLSKSWRNSFGGWGATLVDTMDTLWLMGLKKDFEYCVKVVEKMDFTTNTEDSLNVFETTIRYLGGLLAAYDISEGKYPVLLEKAKELGEILYLPFDTPNYLPVARWEWKQTALGGHLKHASLSAVMAELGSLTLEFTRLSQVTKDPKWFDAVNRISTILDEKQDTTRVPGLWPTIVNIKDLDFDYNHFTMGGMVDSVYEYLPKQHMLLGGLDEIHKKMYLKAIDVAKKHLFFRPLNQQDADILFSGNTGIGQSRDIVTEPQGQHLTCFVGGMVGIASKIFDQPNDLAIARKLVDGCIWSYSSTPSGLMPEVFNIAPCHAGVTPGPNSNITQSSCKWDDDAYYTAVAAQQPKVQAVAELSSIEAGKWWVKSKGLIPPYTDIADTRYILRPEAIESVFILYRITGDASLLDSAWTMFQAIERATRTEIAHAGVVDVRKKEPAKMDRMESFWLAETLKYFYLIFSEPDLCSLDEYVLNTEAHPFRRPRPGEML